MKNWQGNLTLLVLAIASLMGAVEAHLASLKIQAVESRIEFLEDRLLENGGVGLRLSPEPDRSGSCTYYCDGYSIGF